jgi:predicted RNase H-related nuclease YkuK (DUF458 family)
MNNQNKTAWPQSEHKATIRLMKWTFLWVLTVAIATFGPRFLWPDNRIVTTIALLINIGTGVGMILANKHFLEQSDELSQKIQLEAMAVTLGATLVGGIAFSLMDAANLIPWDAEIGFLIMFMGITYIISVVIGRIRYL